MNEIMGAGIAIVSFCLGLFARYLIQYFVITKKELKFRIEERMIGRSLNSLCELSNLLGEMENLFREFEAVDKKHLDIEEARHKVKKDIEKSLRKAQKWFLVNRFFLPKVIKEMYEYRLYDVALEVTGTIPYEVNKEILKKLHDGVHMVETALEKIFKDYNPFYNLKI